MSMTTLQIQQDVDNLLLNTTLGNLLNVVQQESENLLLSKDLAGNPPLYVPLSATDWGTFKTFILNGGGPSGILTPLPQMWNALQVNAQTQFLVMAWEVLKVIIKQYRLQLPVPVLTPVAALERMQTSTPIITASVAPPGGTFNYTTYPPYISIH